MKRIIRLQSVTVIAILNLLELFVTKLLSSISLRKRS